MIHDRASFGGVVLAVGLFYLWLVEFPLRARAGGFGGETSSSFRFQLRQFSS